ncbi:MAG: 4Fe-4S binding protein [Candidatus Krumholzibacteria bacterium]|nr:4Fe-4S binding protein [Candidatus Krumholzibacteria bacterium]
MNCDPKSGRRVSFVKIILFSLVLLFLAALLWADEEGDHRPALGFWGIMAYPRYWMSLIFGLLGFILLWKVRFTRNLRLLFLPVIFFVFSLVKLLPLGTFARRLGLHPSPVCTLTKPFLFFEEGKVVPLVFWVSLLVITVLTLLGNKLFCGWVCPIGALQELIHRIPLPKRLKLKIPFRVANSIRVVIFALFILFVFMMGIEIYEYFSPFEALHWNLEAAGLIILGAVMLVALFIWRPFCYFVCPLGLLTWVLEQFSIFRVKVEPGICTDCDRCIRENPCLAMPAIVKDSRIRPDCFACGLCLDSCTKKGLSYGRR